LNPPRKSGATLVELVASTFGWVTGLRRTATMGATAIVADNVPVCWRRAGLK
jgi:hypothetical protein